MNLLPIEFLNFILPFASLFSKRTWHWGLVLLVGAIFASGKCVRCLLWKCQLFQTSISAADMVKVPQTLLERWTDLLCYAA